MKESSLIWLRKQSLNILSMLAGWHIASKYTDNPFLESMGGILAGAIANIFNDSVYKEIADKAKSEALQKQKENTKESKFDANLIDNTENNIDKINCYRNHTTRIKTEQNQEHKHSAIR